jgi:putative transcriptional regulator
MEEEALEQVPYGNEGEKNRPGQLARALLETADDMRRVGVLDAKAHAKITLRHLGDTAKPASEPISAAEIRAMRGRAHLSQAVFARYLNLTVGYVSQLERGTKRPTGPALVLLNVIRRKGIEAIL